MRGDATDGGRSPARIGETRLKNTIKTQVTREKTLERNELGDILASEEVVLRDASFLSPN